MTFNSDKFECLRFWPGKIEQPPFIYRAPDGQSIEVKDDLRDLGVRLSSDLSFRTHIQSVVASANKIVGWVLRTFRRRSPYVMLTLWHSLIQSKLDYCAQLWSPMDQSSISLLESVARQFTAKIAGFEEKNYWERLKEGNLLSQERRRERSRIIFVWKALRGWIAGYSFQVTYSDRRGRQISVAPYPRNSPASVRNARESSMQVQGARLFNSLPRYIRDISTGSVESFKTELDGWLDSIPDQPTIPNMSRSAVTNSILDQINYRTEEAQP